MQIDSHQHFWQYDPEKHSWINDKMIILKTDFLPVNLKKVYAKNNIDGCIAVQANQTEAETDFLLELALKNNFIKGVVGWVDLRASNIEERLQQYVPFPKLKGFRHVVQEEKEPNFIIGKEFTRGISLLQKYGFTYDILIFPHQLEASLKLIEQFPEQQFVIDHIAKPDIKNRKTDNWEPLIRSIAKHKNVYCKVCGMVTEADWKHWKQEDFKIYLDVVFEAFGNDRILFGSDWPVCLLGGSYTEIKGILDNYISHFSQSDKNKIMGENAMKFYNIH
jgi:L-fuconolactonase